MNDIKDKVVDILSTDRAISNRFDHPWPGIGSSSNANQNAQYNPNDLLRTKDEQRKVDELAKQQAQDRVAEGIRRAVSGEVGGFVQESRLGLIEQVALLRKFREEDGDQVQKMWVEMDQRLRAIEECLGIVR